MAFRDPVQKTDLSSGVCIVAPAGSPYQAAARRLKTCLERMVSAEVDILADNARNIGGRHAVALGNMMDSAFLRGLYFRAYDLTDYAWPGPGGWALRTVPHSVAGTGHVIVAGVSQAADAPDAAEALTAEIDAAGANLPYLHRVHPGRWGALYEKPAQERLKKGDETLEREFTTGAGDWNYMSAIAEIGMLAVQTGNEALMEMFCRQVCQFARTRWFERHLPDPPQIHGFLRTLLLPFAAIENHPGISRALREETLEAFLGLYRSTEGAGNAGFLSRVGVNHVRQNHQTRSALDLYYGGRYFNQVHGLAEGLAWIKLAEVFFEPQMASNKPVCDSWGHQWAASLFNTADYALAAGKMEYFQSAPFLEGVDRALMAHSSLEGGPLQYFLMAAASTENDEYLQLCQAEEEDGLVRRAMRGREEPLRTWVTGRRPQAPARLGKVGVAPLSRLFYESMEHWAGLAPAGVYMRNVPFEQAFDKIFFRSGWTDADDYLLLDGISGGSHSYQDANCIVRYTSRGKTWFGGRVGYGPASVREHVGVSVAVNGAGPGCESRYAALRYVRDGENLSVAGTKMRYPDQADWLRHIVYSREGWFLVIDEVCPLREGEFLVEVRWHVLGDIALSGNALYATQDDVRLTMAHVGSAHSALTPAGSDRETKAGMRWVQRSLQTCGLDRCIRFATLFWTDRTDHPRQFALTFTPSGYRINGGDMQTVVDLVENGSEPIIEQVRAALPAVGRTPAASDAGRFLIPSGDVQPVWTGMCAGTVTAVAAGTHTCFAGDSRGGVTAFDVRGNALWRTEISGAVRTLLALGDGGVAAGGDGEAVWRLDASGKAVWTHQLAWQPMNWDYWTRKNCTVQSLSAVDIDGDGKQEIMAGCADRHIYAFGDGGNLRWRSACQWGPPVCLDVARLEDGADARILAGMADPAIFGCIRMYDANGACVQTLSRPDVMCWAIPSWTRCLRVADLGGTKVISGLDTNHRQLIVYRGNGDIVWEADLGGAVLAVEVADGRVYAGAANGFLQCFSTDGNRLWHQFLVSPIIGLAPDGSGGCLAALREGPVVFMDHAGTVKTTATETSGATVSTWAQCWPQGGLIAGREDGTVAYFGIGD